MGGRWGQYGWVKWWLVRSGQFISFGWWACVGGRPFGERPHLLILADHLCLAPRAVQSRSRGAQTDLGIG